MITCTYTKNYVSLIGCSDEGTITTLPTSVSVALMLNYIWDVDTSGGDIDFTALSALTNLTAGANVIFRNTGENNILFDQDINGVIATYTAQGLGDTLKLCFNGTSYQVIG